ncbi:hypothetical protein [Nitrosomonas marina]|uniref:Uncharacterized protein n=1 Tax=Nitrosomonas marina TaxID=917 RepID=A0A1H8J1G6_9PROT|nr:hypothetical protein [Nitrosomonas marina]SEN74531.1 hypothetical protein SAMN05216325_1493 [Nitrosomonas marina]
MKKKLDPIQEIMLLLLATSVLSTDRIATTLWIDKQLAEFHIRELVELRYIGSLFDIFTTKYYTYDMDYLNEQVWLIEQKGRKYLVDRGLLK